jgi:hypothetical protein
VIGPAIKAQPVAPVALPVLVLVNWAVQFADAGAESTSDMLAVPTTSSTIR